MKELQDKAALMRQKQETFFKEQMKTQNDFLAESNEAQKKLLADQKEKVSQIDASIQSLLKEREKLTQQQTGFSKADSPE
jgi:hypothetical protein